MASLLYRNDALVLPLDPSARFRLEQARLISLSVESSHPSFISRFPLPRPKAVFVLGSSGTGKSKLAIDLSLRFGGEVINSDKMQVYDGLRVITNVVGPEECAGVPHHLLGGVHPDVDFSAAQFRREAAAAADGIARRGRLPIIAGGSNSYIRELVSGDNGAFARRFDCCFVWVDVDRGALDAFVAERVDKMVELGLVEEARGMCHPDADYTKGVRRSIGVPEMDMYFRREGTADHAERFAMLREAFDAIKENTSKLTRVQREKIVRFEAEDGWRLHRVDATAAIMRRSEAGGRKVWEETVVGPSVETVARFVHEDAPGFVCRCGVKAAAAAKTAAAVGTAT